MGKISRRSFFKLAGAAAASRAIDAHAATPSSQRTAYIFFNPEEANFIEAAVERLIPADETGPGARDAGVPIYLDRQLAGAWGAGERLYRSGPWREGSETQGYQLSYTPAELFRHALRGIRNDLVKRGSMPFHKLNAQQQDAYLKTLESGRVDLEGVPSKVFFSSLLDLTIEGYFSDPVYGGNKDMVAWKMIGFPGAYATYYHLVDQHGLRFEREPMSLAQDVRGVIHIHPNIPAHLQSSGGK
jgi:gluconate 2-dehydrogenase gamma chain